nr:L,D-transpeptidase family protein [uncultured Sphingosinicella sp.]
MMFRRAASLLLLLSFSGAAAARPGYADFPIEPVEIPPSIQQGLDLIYIDPEIAPAVRERDKLLKEIGIEDKLGSPVDLLLPLNPFYTDLRRGLTRYRAAWGRLPQVQVPSGPLLKPGAKGERVSALRERLGLGAGSVFDESLANAVRRYQKVHGIKADGIAGEGTIASLNLGADHYKRLLKINLERARRLPGTAEKGRYVLVDVGAARIYLFENGRVQDTMKAIVGKPGSATPMMAALIRYASINPYWNVPPDLAKTLVAPRVLADGLGHLKAERYEVLSDWTTDATVVDPSTIDWKAVADGTTEIRVRQLPGRGNSMGAIKFMLPNEFGIYLHDSPDKSLFNNEERWISNGCVRVEDARKLATWLFGDMPKAANPDREEDVGLAGPVPVYMSYLTAGATSEGIVFRKDRYDRDAAVLARYSIGAGKLAMALE